MRIGMIAPLIRKVPPHGYGGAEEVLSLLTEELVRRGHRVTLFASGDSITAAELVPVVPLNLADADITDQADSVEANTYDLIAAVICFRRAGEFDVIHNHVSPAAMAMSNLVSTPVLTTVHGGQSTGRAAIWDVYRGSYTTVSHAMRSDLPDEGYVGTVHNAVDHATFPFSNEAGDYLLSLGRIAYDKGTDLTIEAARRLGENLVIAGNVNAPDRGYFENEIRPAIDGKSIRYVGEVDSSRKRELFVGARCLLFPMRWEEPFGMVMLEAMACGTPVVAYDRGAAREVVAVGETGFVVSDIDGFVEAVRNAHTIDRQKCRQHVEENFGVARMADEYVEVYKRIAS